MELIFQKIKLDIGAIKKKENMRGEVLHTVRTYKGMDKTGCFNSFLSLGQKGNHKGYIYTV